MKSTGAGKKKKPVFFEDMHSVIAARHSSRPVRLLNSISDNNSPKDEEKIENSEMSTQSSYIESGTQSLSDSDKGPTSIFKNVKKSVRLR